MYGDNIAAASVADGWKVQIGRDPIYLALGAPLPEIDIA